MVRERESERGKIRRRDPAQKKRKKMSEKKKRQGRIGEK